MTENKKKQRFMALPVENHKTAAWIGNTKEVKPQSKVVIPAEQEVIESKEWVDSNQL